MAVPTDCAPEAGARLLSDLWTQALSSACEQVESTLQDAWTEVRRERSAMEAAGAELASEK